MADARSDTPRVREVAADDRDWITGLLEAQWGSTTVVSRGRAHRADRLPGFVAFDSSGRTGLLTYRIDSGDLEIVTLNALAPRRGVGSALLCAARRTASRAGCARVWLITTNDNVPAIGFYGKLGFECVAVHAGAVEVARRLKPEIPQLGRDGVPIRDELEFEVRLST
jgi:ribosomal protein S18 acetylase RimI-like enzyme